MRELFYELIREAVDGKVLLFNDSRPIGFNTIILKDNEEKIVLRNNRNLSMLYIKNEDLFFRKLKEYIDKELKANRRIPIQTNERDKIKYIMTYLWIYATTEDFLNPIEYIQRKIDFLDDHTFDEFEEKTSVSLKPKINANIEISQETNSIAMETPKKIVMKLTHPEQEHIFFPLPSIYYAIHNENGKKVCYIYSILMPKKQKTMTEEELNFQKQMNRLLYKVNDGIIEHEEYNRDDCTNIKDVSMSFLFGLNIFISLLQRKGIETIKAVPYLPVCFLAREIAASESENRDELRERNLRIQDNQTTKFVRTFKRLCAQNDALQILSCPYEMDEFLTMRLKSRTKRMDNVLLEESNKAVVGSTKK